MYLATSDFGDGQLGSWKRVNNAVALTAQVVDDRATARQGRKFMRVRTSQVDGSVAHDVLIAGTITREVYNPPAPNLYVGAQVKVVRSLQFSVWMRSADPQRNVQGALAIWDLAAAAELRRFAKDPAAAARSASFDVGRQWTQVFVCYNDITPSTYAGNLEIERSGGAPDNIRAEIYLKTLNLDLDVDAAMLI